MQRIILLGTRLIASAIAIVGFCANAQVMDRVAIDATTRDAVQVLVSSLQQANRFVDGKPVPIIVELCNVDLDLTGHSLVIGSDRSLIASPACARGPRSFGPRIFATDHRVLGKPLFQIRGDNILFSGFRLEGPSKAISAGHARLERAITIAPFESPAPIHKIEISNMDLPLERSRYRYQR